MFIYTVVVITIVLISSGALAFILMKNNMLALRTMLAIIFSTITTIALCLVFPFFIGSLADMKINKSSASLGLGIIWSGIIALVIFITIIFFMTILISSIISEKREKTISDKIKNSYIKNIVSKAYQISLGALLGLWNSVLKILPFNKKAIAENTSQIQDFQEYKEESGAVSEIVEDTLLMNSELGNVINIDIPGKSDVFDDILEEDTDFVPNIILEDELQGKNILEKFVDSEQNTDKMGVETVSIGQVLPEEISEIDLSEFDNIENLILENSEKVNIEEDYTEEYVPIKEDFDVSIDYFNENGAKSFVELKEDLGQVVQEILISDEQVALKDSNDLQTEVMLEDEEIIENKQIEEENKPEDIIIEQELEPEIELEVEQELESEIEAEIQQELEPEIELEIEQELEPEIELEVEQELELEIETEIEQELEPEIEIQIEQELEPEIEREIEQELEPEIETEIEQELEPEIEREIEQELEPEIELEIDQEVEPEIELEIEQKLDPEIELEALSKENRDEVFAAADVFETENINEEDENIAEADMLIEEASPEKQNTLDEPEEIIGKEDVPGKIGETKMEDTKMGIDDYIDEAFRLKENGDLEGALLYYMYALDKKPDNDLVYWIILDTCVLYKELGQAALAKEILESYVASYGDLMDEAIKSEIEKNLL